MKLEDKERLFVELKKFYKDNYSRGNLKSPKLNLGLRLIDEFDCDKKEALKSLLKNEHGLIGNLMYKYILSPDKDVLEFIMKNDKRIITSAIKEFRRKVIWENGLSNCLNEMLWIIDINEGYIDEIGYYLIDNNDFFYEIAKKHPHLLDKLKTRKIKDRDLLLKCIFANPECIKYLPQWVRKNKEMVLEAVKINGRLLLYTSTFFNDKDIVYAAVKSNGMALESVDKCFKDDEELARIAVSNSPWSYRNISERLRDNKEITLIAVKGNGSVLAYASDRLKNHKEIVYAAVKNNAFAFQYVSDKYKDDKQLALIAIKKEKLMYKYLSDRLKRDIDIINNM